MRLLSAADAALSELSGLGSVLPNPHLLIAPYPYLAAAWFKRPLGISDPTARKRLGKLEAAGIVRETTGRSWGRQYLADGVLAAIDDPGEETPAGQPL